MPPRRQQHILLYALLAIALVIFLASFSPSARQTVHKSVSDFSGQLGIDRTKPVEDTTPHKTYQPQTSILDEVNLPQTVYVRYHSDIPGESAPDAAGAPAPDALYATLKNKLTDLLARPIQSHDSALRHNSAFCPQTRRQANKDQLAGDGVEFWPVVATDELVRRRREAAEYIFASFGFDPTVLSEDGGDSAGTEGAGGAPEAETDTATAVEPATDNTDTTSDDAGEKEAAADDLQKRDNPLPHPVTLRKRQDEGDDESMEEGVEQELREEEALLEEETSDELEQLEQETHSMLEDTSLLEDEGGSELQELVQEAKNEAKAHDSQDDPSRPDDKAPAKDDVAGSQEEIEPNADSADAQRGADKVDQAADDDVDKARPLQKDVQDATDSTTSAESDDVTPEAQAKNDIDEVSPDRDLEDVGRGDAEAKAVDDRHQQGEAKNAAQGGQKNADQNEAKKKVPTEAEKEVTPEKASKKPESSPSTYKKGTTNLAPGEWDALFGTKPRGIVYTAGSPDMYHRAKTSIKALREFNCTLPVEIWSFSGEVASNADVISEITALGGVEIRTVSTSPINDGRWKQFQIKAEAVTHSSFTEVLYLDSDNIPLRNPEVLFRDPLYRAEGAVFWPDFSKDAPSNAVFRLLGVDCNPLEWQVESGQMLLNKRARGGLVLAALRAAEAMQNASEFWFRLSGGDKDTFRYGFYMIGEPYGAAPRWLAAGGRTLNSQVDGHKFCGHSMIQFGLSAAEWDESDVVSRIQPGFTITDHPPPLFVHANLLKHASGVFGRGQLFTSIKMPSNDRVDESLVLGSMRHTVYNHQGMCADMWDARAKEGAGEGGASPVGAYERGRVDVVQWKDAWGGLLAGFERIYYG